MLDSTSLKIPPTQSAAIELSMPTPNPSLSLNLPADPNPLLPPSWELTFGNPSNPPVGSGQSGFDDSGWDDQTFGWTILFCVILIAWQGRL